ncbi:MAG TPA: UvrD-helicase domain-containing protein [Candidatus Paceibacterota bacterium]
MTENFKHSSQNRAKDIIRNIGLNPEQVRAANAPVNKPLLIVAGAGTGKTRTLTSRIVYLMSQGVPGENICAITFTNKAAREMLERVHGYFDGELAQTERPRISTFHSLGARILRRYHARTGRTANFAIFDENDSFHALKKTLKRLDMPHKEGPAWFAEKISQIKNKQLNPEELESSSRAVERAVPLVFEEYEKELARNNGFDFNDLIYQTNRLFTANPETRDHYHNQFTHILVDEYQDINNSQYEMLRHLVGKGARLSVVGDDQQTIYSWRGSNFEIFLNFERDWPEAEAVVLEQNYRSAGNILRAAGAVIKNNRRQKQKNLRPVLPEGEKIKLIEALDEEQEAAWVVYQIQNLKTPPSLGSGRASKNKSSEREKADEESVAILYRTNAQSRAIEQALLRANIPYLVFGGIKFYERKEIKDLLAAVRFLSNPQDGISRERLEKNFGKRRTATFSEAMRGKNELTPADALKFCIEHFNYINYMVQGLTNPLERQENILELMRFASEFQKLSDFLEQVTLLQATDQPRNKTDNSRPVYLMTIHLAKGLEFDAVFITGCNEGLLPHARAIGPEETEEERRLMYVAMTRAKHKLFLSFYDAPSRFLGEIPPELMIYKNPAGDGGADSKEEFEDSEERYISW